VRVHISRSLSVLENDSLMALAGADVSLYDGDQVIAKFQEQSQGFYSIPGFYPQAGHTYRLNASHATTGSVVASAYLPPVVPILSVDTATFTTEWGQQGLRLSVRFSDPPGQHNIYAFGAEATFKEFDYQTMSYTGKKLTHPVYIYDNDDQFIKEESINFDGTLYFEDLLFDGQSKTVTFGISDYSYYDSDTVWLKVQMEQIDPSYFLYVRSYKAYEQARGNPFAEPVQVYTNVQGGYGIFAGSSAAGFSIITAGRRRFR
jgi:hypothetical protein